MDEETLDRSVELMLAMTPTDITRLREQLERAEPPPMTPAEADALCDAAALGLGYLHAAKESGELREWLNLYKQMQRGKES